MIRSIISLAVLFFSLSVSSQNHSASYTSENSEMISETIRFLDTSGNQVTVRIPSDTCILFYRIRGKTWISDNRDSVELIENIIEGLQNSAKDFMDMKIICYAYNADNFMRNQHRTLFKSSLRYKVEYLSLPEKSAGRTVNGDKIVLLNKKGKILASSPFISSFRYRHRNENRKIKAKLMTEMNGTRHPLSNTTIYLFSKLEKDTISFAQTDRYGDFELNLPEAGTEHTIKVEPPDKSVKNIILADQNGVEQARLKRSVTIFEYRLIEADIIRLSDMPEKDLVFVVKDFLKSGEKEFVKSESIGYSVGSHELPEESRIIIDRMAAILNDHPGLNLQVVSHTDSQGDDKMNLELSEKRALNVVTYLMLIGIEKRRLRYIGKGETEIRNRCKNGVDCSPREHSYNRRTEFRFLKN